VVLCSTIGPFDRLTRGVHSIPHYCHTQSGALPPTASRSYVYELLQASLNYFMFIIIIIVVVVVFTKSPMGGFGFFNWPLVSIPEIRLVKGMYFLSLSVWDLRNCMASFLGKLDADRVILCCVVGPWHSLGWWSYAWLCVCFQINPLKSSGFFPYHQF